MKWLGAFIFIGVCCTSSLRAGCVNILSRIHHPFSDFDRSFESLIPLGVSNQDFRDFLKFLEEDPAFADAESVILYGSRTNHSEGLLPQSNSDLDIRVLWRAQALGDELSMVKQLERVQLVNQVLEPWSKRLGFKVSVEIPSFVSLSEFIGELPPMHRAIFEMKKLDRQSHGQTEEERMAQKIKSNAILVRYRLPINPGTIFILKGQAQSALLQERLRALGVRKMILLGSGM